MIQQNQAACHSQVEYSLKLKSSHIIYNPQPFADNEKWYHPFLGYPKCPLIGRYNKGEYRIGDVIQHLEFICKYQQKQSSFYRCGNRKIAIPDILVYDLRNIPQIIQYNKPKNLKNEPDVHLIAHIPQYKIKLNWIISFGQIGKDFLNYLNHAYIFDQTVFYDEKLNRTTTNIPIVAYMPQNSGLYEKEVQRGISMNQWRSEYMSIHLKGGAPAFSPNNMRLGVAGMKKVVSSNNKNQNKQKGKHNKNENKKKYVQKQKIEKNNKNEEQASKKQIKSTQQVNQMSQKLQQLFGPSDDQKQEAQKVINNKTSTQTTKPHNGTFPQIPIDKFVHFYTAVLLQNDHRVNYHWYVQDLNMQDIIKQLLNNTSSIQQFVDMYKNVLGEDALVKQIVRLLCI